MRTLYAFGDRDPIGDDITINDYHGTNNRGYCNTTLYPKIDYASPTCNVNQRKCFLHLAKSHLSASQNSSVQKRSQESLLRTWVRISSVVIFFLSKNADPD